MSTFKQFIKTILYSDDDCADAISETIVKAFAKVHTLRQDSYAKTWLVRILLNECYTIQRRSRWFAPADRLPEVAASRQEEVYSPLYEAIRRLPEEQRIAVTLYYVEGYAVRETAELLHVTENVIKKRLMRARKALREELTQEDSMEDAI